MDKAYRILLVDDESEVRESIIKKVDWESTGFKVVGDAENGQDALEKIEYLEPDVVLTDIRMPYMDGLELAAALRESMPSVKVVIFSGFDDFEYAKQAISLNIIEYILKPVNAEELKEILIGIKNTLDEEIANLKDANALKESFVRNLPILRENFLNNLIRSRVEEHQIQPKMKEYGIELGEGKCWTSIQIIIDKLNEYRTSGLNNEDELVSLSVKRLIDSQMKKRFFFESFHSNVGFYAISCLGDEFKISEFISLLSEVCSQSKKILSQPLTIGVGQPVHSLSKLKSSYNEAKDAIGYKAIEGVGDVIYIGDMEPSPENTLVLEGRWEGILVSALKFGEKDKIISCAKELSDNIRKARLHKSQYQAYIISILNVIIKTIHRYELDWEDIFGKKADYLEILQGISDADALEQWIVVVGFKVGENLKDERQDSTKNMIKSSKKYINDNYGNSEISLDTICNYLHISTTYFSTVFKREVGETYTSYLTKVRLEKAAELLTTTDEKTYLIARQVGYEEPNYFGYVFKKKFGVSPNKYRGK